MTDEYLNLYANDQLMIIDWNYGKPIPEGILLTLNDKALPNAVQGVFLAEKGHFLMLTLVPNLTEIPKAKFEIRGKDASLIAGFNAKSKLKPFSQKELQKFSPQSVTKILRALLRKAPLTFKEIKNDILRDLCKLLALNSSGLKLSDELYISLPCAFADQQKAGPKEVLIWRLHDGMADSYEKLTAFWQDDQLHFFVPDSFIADEKVHKDAIYVIEDADSFIIPFALGKSRKLPKGLSLLETLSQEKTQTAQLKAFLNKTVKKKPVTV